MNNKIFEKGNIDWAKDHILDELDKFISIYDLRPVKNNKGGMLFPQMFYFYFLLKIIKPDIVVESGIYKGQSTWLIEKTLPNAEIIALDIDLNQREYISKNVKYSSTDFKFQDFSNISKNSLVFFDDHINHVDRLLESKYFNFKHVVFEDNYPPGKGDFQTLKQLYNKHTFVHNPGLLSLIKTNLILSKIIIKKTFTRNYNVKKEIDKLSKRIRDGYSYNFSHLEQLIESYFEFPPLTLNSNTNSDLRLLMKDPLFEKVPEHLKKYTNYLGGYNFLTYIKLL